MKQQFSTVHLTAIGRVSVPLLIMGISLWLLADMIDPALFAGLPDALVALPLAHCMLAAGFCGLSLWAVARYDGLAHRHFQTGITDRMARKSGFAAIAIAQTIGFGVLTGAAVRWRMLPHIGLKGAMQLSVFVSVTFISALAFLSALACLFLPAPGWTILPAFAVAIGLPIALIMLSFSPLCASIRHRIQIPSLRAVRAILGWSGLDLLAAALALYVLIPAADLSFAAFLPVFMLALGAAMLSGAPGGVGPFELTLISLLPQVPTAELITAILMFRALYYGAPAVLAVAVVFATPRARPVAHPVTHAPGGQQMAELGILAQNAGHLRQHQSGSYALWKTSQTATLLFDPATGPTACALADLRRQAKAHTRTACLYKCNARTALAARHQGWVIARIAQDYVLDLATYDLSDVRRRGLRRKVRKAQKAGVTVTRARHLPLDQMARIDALWQARQGPARGGTMGRFCPTYLAGQDVFLAHQHGRLIGFASFHRDAHTPCLDLMRHLPDLPDGTMHLIVQTAIDTARREGKHALSLAAAPDMPLWTTRTGPFRRHFENPGLRQFKASFAPRTLPRYAAAPSRSALAIALADITLEVHWPKPLNTISRPHKQDEDYEIALRR